MKQKGWGLTEMVLLTGILVLALLIVGILVYINFRDLERNGSVIDSKEESNSYKELEDKMVKAAKDYLEIKEDNKTEKVVVTLKTLETVKALEPIYDVKTGKTKCSGYVLAEQNEDEITYNPYLKCSFKYQTKGYSQEYDE